MNHMNSPLLAVIISGIQQGISIECASAVAGRAIVSNRAAANDNDPFAGAFERLAGTQKREPYGEPFGDQSRIGRLGKGPSLKG